MTIIDGTYQNLYAIDYKMHVCENLKKGYTLIINDTECFKYVPFSWKFICVILMRCADTAQS